MEELQELRNEILNLRNFELITKNKELQILQKLNKIEQQLTLTEVSQQRELLLDFMKKLDRVDHQDLQDGYYLELADRFLANNCG
jgi:hypothetical protein